MAKEITFGVSFSITKGGLTDSFTESGLKFDVTGGPGKTCNIQNIGTTQEAIALGADLGSPGWAFFYNMDDTNYLQLGVYESSTFYPFARLGPGQLFVMRLDAACVPYAKANTAACNLEYIIYTD